MRSLATLLLLCAVTGCQYGAPPRIPYVEGTTYVAPDGHRKELTGQGDVGVTAFTPYRGGFLVADSRFFEGSLGLAFVRGRERVPLGPCATGGGRPNADRTKVAWLTTGCPEARLLAKTVLHVEDVHGVGGWSRELTHHSLRFVVGFVGDDVVVAGWGDPVQLVPEHGPIVGVPHLRHAVDTHGTLIAGQESVVDIETGSLLWKAPGTHLISFSPDGRLLVGFQRHALVLVDARTGAVRATLPNRLDRLTWEDDRHLLAVTWGRGREAMVRVGLGGRAVLLGAAQPVPPRQPYRYVFQTNP